MRRAWKSRRKPGRLEDKALPAAFSEGDAIGSSTPRSRNPCNTSLFRSGGALLEKSLVQRLLATYLAGGSGGVGGLAERRDDRGRAVRRGFAERGDEVLPEQLAERRRAAERGSPEALECGELAALGVGRDV